MSQTAVHDLLEASVAELAAAGTSAVLRQRIAGTFQRWTGARDVLFLERSGDATYACTLALGSAADSTGAHGPLIRWLRVNNEILVFRERPEVLTYLTADERAAVEHLACDACVPLVRGGVLVAFLFVCRISDPQLFSQRRPLLEAYAARAADTWQQLVHLETVQARQDALGHTHRLGIAGQMAASVAHEVRNPLAAIRSLVQFVRDTPLPPDEQVSILGDVLQEVDRIDQSVAGMLHLSRPSAARKQALDLNDLVQSVSRFVRSYANRRGVVISVDAHVESIQVRGDDLELRQVVTNLLLNAIQACENGGRVDASVRAGSSADGTAEVEIVDSGQGIAPEFLPRIFEPFFTTKPQGTGLGLAFCRDVAERHGGTIAVTSAPGQGTRVHVRLPTLEVDEFHPGG